MNIKFSMPELLVLFSLLMYSQSFWFAVISFNLGLLARIIDYIMDYSAELKKAETINENISEAAESLKNMFKQ